MTYFINTNEIHNLKLNFKMGVRQVVEKIEESGFAMIAYKESRPYKLNYGYYSCFFENESKQVVMLNCSNDEQLPIVMYNCLRLGRFLFVPLNQILSLKSYGWTNRLIYLAFLDNVKSELDQAVTKFHNLLNDLASKSLDLDQIRQIAMNSIAYRAYKLKVAQVFDSTQELVACTTGYEVLVVLLRDLLRSRSKNNSYFGLIENRRQVNNISEYVIRELLKA